MKQYKVVSLWIDGGVFRAIVQLNSGFYHIGMYEFNGITLNDHPYMFYDDAVKRMIENIF